MFVKPPLPRHTTVEQPGGLTIRIPGTFHLLAPVFLLGVVYFWGGGEWSILRGLAADFPRPLALAADLFGLCLWTALGAAGIFVCLWHIRGRETVTLTDKALSLRREACGVGRTTHFDLAVVRALRVAPAAPSGFHHTRVNLVYWLTGGGRLAFDYGQATFRFVTSLSEAEVRDIFQEITGHFPQLAAPLPAAGDR